MSSVSTYGWPYTDSTYSSVYEIDIDVVTLSNGLLK